VNACQLFKSISFRLHLAFDYHWKTYQRNSSIDVLFLIVFHFQDRSWVANNIRANTPTAQGLAQQTVLKEAFHRPNSPRPQQHQQQRLQSPSVRSPAPHQDTPPIRTGPRQDTPPIRTGPHQDTPPIRTGLHPDTSPIRTGPHQDTPPIRTGHHQDTPPIRTGHHQDTPAIRTPFTAQRPMQLQQRLQSPNGRSSVPHQDTPVRPPAIRLQPLQINRSDTPPLDTPPPPRMSVAATTARLQHQLAQNALREQQMTPPIVKAELPPSRMHIGPRPLPSPVGKVIFFYIIPFFFFYKVKRTAVWAWRVIIPLLVGLLSTRHFFFDLNKKNWFIKYSMNKK